MHRNCLLLTQSGQHAEQNDISGVMVAVILVYFPKDQLTVKPFRPTFDIGPLRMRGGNNAQIR